MRNWLFFAPLLILLMPASQAAAASSAPRRGLTPVAMQYATVPSGTILQVRLDQAIDTSTPMGKAMFTIIAAMAELESSLISERTVAAMEFARTHGTRTGRTIGRQPRVFRRDLARDLLLKGKSYREIAETMGLSISSVREFMSRAILRMQSVIHE